MFDIGDKIYDQQSKLISDKNTTQKNGLLKYRMMKML